MSDLNVFYFFNNLAEQSRTFDALVIFLAGYFQYFLIAIFLLLLFFSGYSKPEKLRLFLVTIISITIARLGVVELIRFFYHRPRPFIAHQVRQLLSENDWSFPSGHSAFFFAMAMAIYFYNKKWGIGFFLAAIVMNISRIIAGVHYPTDIIGGAVIGMAVAYIVFYFAEKARPKEIIKTL